MESVCSKCRYTAHQSAYTIKIFPVSPGKNFNVHITNATALPRKRTEGLQLLRKQANHLFIKLNDFIANAKITAKKTEKLTTIIPAIPTKSCLNPKTFLTKTLVGSE